MGTVINRASRLENTTKLFGNCTTAIGNSLYKNLLSEFHPETRALLKKFVDYDSLINEHPEAVLISKEYMLQYVFDMELKGIQDNAPIFRLSESLSENDDLYWGLIEKMVGLEKMKKIKEIILNHQ